MSLQSYRFLWGNTIALTFFKPLEVGEERRVEVLAFGACGASVGYGVVGADVVASQAEGAVVAPGGSGAGCGVGSGREGHGDVAGGAGGGAEAAGGAGVGGAEGARRHGVADKPGVDDRGLEAWE